MRITADRLLNAPIGDVWTIVTEPERVLDYMSGVTRWEVAGDIRTGFGARYRMLFRIGAAEIGGLVEVVEFDERCDVAWTSVTGLITADGGACARPLADGPASSSGSRTSWPAPA
jgi:uncharacterized protein YndB with AHSA1/START domain